jgi:hypothetical protein
MAKVSGLAATGRARLPLTWPVEAPAPLMDPLTVSVLAPVDSTPLVKVSVPATVALALSVSEPPDLLTVRLLKVGPPPIVCAALPVKVTVLDCALKLPSPVQLPVRVIAALPPSSVPPDLLMVRWLKVVLPLIAWLTEPLKVTVCEPAAKVTPLLVQPPARLMLPAAVLVPEPDRVRWP